MAPKKRSFTDEVRNVAEGFRWGRRPAVPRNAEAHTPPPERWAFPTDWARTEAGRSARDAILLFVMKPLVWNETSPEVFGLDNLEGMRPPVMFISTPLAPSTLPSSKRGLEMAFCDASTARPVPRETPIPITARPV